uniref:Astacin domain-containing protein n=1 Tax=Strongyloides papillosus TaxID=174720 RepID=A0A0N5BS81_STREA
MGLALGLVPEITRNDRKFNVNVTFKNIKSTHLKYYKVQNYESKVLGNTSFDFYSKMLSRQFFGSKNGKETYNSESPLFKYYRETKNLTAYFDYNDFKRLWFLHCDMCGQKEGCSNNGYFRLDCNKCECPIPFAGNRCRHIYYNDLSKCGTQQEYIATSKWNRNTINITDAFCYYVIKSTTGKKVQVNLLEFSLSNRKDCPQKSGLEVKYRKDKGAGGLRSCTNYNETIYLPALTSELHFIFSEKGNNELKFSYKEV